MLFFLTYVYCDISPSLADPALLSVVGVVDGQVTVQVSWFYHEKKFIYRASYLFRVHWYRLQTCNDQNFHLQSALVQTSLLYSISRPPSSKECNLLRHLLNEAIKNEVHLALARGEATAVVLLDQSAAFDTIDHGTLIECLSSWFGVGRVVLNWFKSYLCDRYQCIKIGSVLSDAKRLLYGVPQGSVPGPILFSLYTTPLSKVIQNHLGICFHFYADDTQLYVHLTHNHATQAFDRLENCLDDVRKWLSANKLKLNPDKTEFILFGSRNVRTKLRKFFPVNILGNLLSPVDAIKNLGVWFDSDFSFSCHVRNTCKASFVHIRDLKRLRGYLTREAAFLAANALVGSRLDYCNSLFRGLSALDIRRLQCVQNSLARIVANTTKYSHITPVRKSLHWLPVLHRSVFKTALLVYKFLHSGHPKYFEPFLKPRHSVYRTRRSQSDGVLLEVPHCASIYKSKKHFGLSFAYDAPRIWNDLPDDVRSAKSLSSFRKKLKTYLFENAYPP